ncbi:hypothetical protein CEXT_161911 [Caerostris extrusa]|uniref:Uncharacterized protein n=1 Tax=Caerostris extrusa TaxID=172846 RepID=A0AAV4T172_CAEEX|nr:hypothetical protein CEXT_161911 [Caerostris extrusa]
MLQYQDSLCICEDTTEYIQFRRQTMEISCHGQHFSSLLTTVAPDSETISLNTLPNYAVWNAGQYLIYIPNQHTNQGLGKSPGISRDWMLNFGGCIESGDEYEMFTVERV